MVRFVLDLDEVDERDARRVGNKAARLGQLRAAGFPVPPGFVVTVDAFRDALTGRGAVIEARLATIDLQSAQDVQSAAQDIDESLASLRLPHRIRSDLQQAVALLTKSSHILAVRSSGTIEDGSKISLAGQYDTVMGVSGFEATVAAILRCWRSYFSPHALRARVLGDSEGPALKNGGGLAVLVQPIIDADCAGICLSMDPVRQNGDCLIINAAWGMGSGVVDGSVPCDTAWVQRRSLRVERHVVVQKKEQLALGDGGQLRHVAVPRMQQNAACLPQRWLTRVAQFGLAIEQRFGRPQEVEWAVSDRRLWVLQSRPLTGLAPQTESVPGFDVTWTDEAEKRQFWELSYWSKADEPPLLPLEQAYTQAMEAMREETCRWLGAERNWERKWANGRLYARQVAVGLSEADMEVRRRAYEDLKRRWRQEGRTAWDYWGPEIVRATERLRAFDAAPADGPALAAHLEEALAVARRHTMLHPMLSFDPSDAYVEAYEAVTGRRDEDARTEATRLLDGEATALSDLIDSLYALAELARGHPALAALVTDPPEDVSARLESLPEAETFQEQLDHILSVYGERTGHGYGSRANLSTATWREKPQIVLQLAAPYLDPALESPAGARARARQRRQAEIEVLCAACEDEDAVTTFRQELAYARRAFRVLEEHNHYVDQMALGQARLAVMSAARFLVRDGVLAEADDALWLTFEEIVSALRGEHTPPLGPLVQQRRLRHGVWQRMEPPPILGLPQADLDERPPWRDEVTRTGSNLEGEIRGLGASAGHARGQARVLQLGDIVSSLSQGIVLPAGVQPGEILVAHNVGPRWTPFFPLLGGIVLDSGSVGQHAAATAREYGIPAVIATGDATRRIADGAWVWLDGEAGVVKIEKETGGRD